MALNFDRYTGLTSAAVEKEQKKSGTNVLFRKKRKGPLDYAMQIFEEPMLLLLLATAIVYFTIGSTWDGVLMLIGVLTMIGIDLYQEAKTDRALEALKEMTTPRISVIRNGALAIIPNEELVKGDLLVVREGERIAGDGKILDSSNFSVDESMLTGESGAIHKSEKSGSKASDTDLAFAGTLVLSGQAVIEIASIGTQTQYGKIGKSLAEIEEKPTPLQIKTGKLVKIFGLVGFISCLSLFFINLSNTGKIIDSLLKGLTLAISVIPEELPVILTVFSALGAYRLAKRNALIRKINAIETLGSVTTLCTDKTGTLTQNKMTLEALVTPEGTFKPGQLSKNNETHVAALKQSVLTCQPEPFDPADLSIFDHAHRIGMDTDELHGEYELAHEYGFDQTVRAMGYAWKNDGKIMLAIKGSAEHVLERCALSAERKAALIQETENLSSQGLRVLAVAHKALDSKQAPNNLRQQKELDFVALLGFMDPLKPSAKQAITTIQKAGIAVRMITGDHPKTAMHIAEAVGIKHKGSYLTGAEIESLPEADLVERIKNCFVFARVIPEQKLKLVGALQKSGEIVAMVGDGVNDAPSLKEADVGIAMGLHGTNVAREASDLILMDDELNTVASAIHDGRRIYDNIQKGVSYIFVIHVYIILTALIIPLTGFPALLLPIHIIMLELLIDPTCSLVFEAMPAEPDVMRRKPRDPKKPIISSSGFARILLTGISVFGLTTIAYFMALKNGADTETARTIGFSIILWSNLFQVLGHVSRHESVMASLKFFGNKSFLAVYAVLLTTYIVLIYVPGLNVKMGLTSIPLLIFAATLILGSLPTIGNDIYKKMRAT